jgi:hypothetical protein
LNSIINLQLPNYLDALLELRAADETPQIPLFDATRALERYGDIGAEAIKKTKTPVVAAAGNDDDDDVGDDATAYLAVGARNLVFTQLCWVLDAKLR